MTLRESEIYFRIKTVIRSFSLEKKSLLVIIPDNTRTAPIEVFFKLFYELLAPFVVRLDYLVALGTHPFMTEEQLCHRVGITLEEKFGIYKDIGIYNHRWDRHATFTKIGTIESSEMRKLSDGHVLEACDITINRMIFDYDAVLIIGPVFPHEVAGFSGSNKYLFPGIGGWNFTDITHWIGAIRTNIDTIGLFDAPARTLIDRAAEFLHLPVIYFNLVVDEEGLKGLFIGDDLCSWREAARLSAEINIRYVPRKYKKVLSIASKKYDDYWTGAKAFYKVEPIVENGGELLVFAPNIREISITHETVVNKIGFHVIDYFVKKIIEFKGLPKSVLAYSSYVKGKGTFDKDIETPRITHRIASGIPKEILKKLNLDWEDISSVDPATWENGKNGDAKVIHNAGEILYRVK